MQNSGEATLPPESGKASTNAGLGRRLLASLNRLQANFVPVELYPRNSRDRTLAISVFQITAALAPFVILLLALFYFVGPEVFSRPAQIFVITILNILILGFASALISLKHGGLKFARWMLTFIGFFAVFMVIQATGGLRVSVAAIFIIIPPIVILYFFSFRAGILALFWCPVLALGLDVGNELLGHPFPDLTSKANETFNRMSVLASTYFFVNLCVVSLFRTGNQLHFEQKTERRHLAKLAHQDALTGIANKRWFEKKLKDHAEQIDRSGGKLVLFNIDLNEFKPVNDRLGHAAGDQLLVLVAHRLRDLCGPDEIAARLGGDEFALILIRDLDEKEATVLSQLIETTIAVPFYLEGQLVQVSGSVGFCIYPTQTRNISRILHHADKDMFRRKAKLRKRKPPSSDLEIPETG